MKLLKLDEMQEIARNATQAALRAYVLPAKIENLTVGTELTKSAGIFELYIAGKRPQDAILISRATVNRETGAVSVEVFLKPIDE